MVAQTNHQITKYAEKINDTVICLQIGKTYTAKTPLGDFQVITSEIPLLSQQPITSKGISALYQSIVEPLPQYPIILVL